MSEEFVKTIASLVGISTIAAASRSILSEDRRSLKGFFRAALLAVFVGGVAGAITTNYGFSPSMQGAVVGLCAFVADDILLGVVNLAIWFRTNPARIIDLIFNRKID